MELNQERGQLPYNPIQEDTWLDCYKLQWAGPQENKITASINAHIKMNPDITTQIYATSRVYRQTFLAVNLYNRLLG